jgi:hypothetical protein
MSFESRNRMISFRLSAEEYEKFRELCFSSGIRSVSEMARVAINTLLQEPRRVSSESLEARVAELEGRLHILALEIKSLNQHRGQWASASTPPPIANGASASSE